MCFSAAPDAAAVWFAWTTEAVPVMVMKKTPDAAAVSPAWAVALVAV
jgi:hypothetical protein